MTAKSLRATTLTGLGLLATSLMFFPIYWLIVTSLKPASELFRRPPTLLPLHVDLSAYVVNVIQNHDFLRYIGNSLFESGSWDTGCLCPGASAYTREERAFTGVADITDVSWDYACRASLRVRGDIGLDRCISSSKKVSWLNGDN